MNKRITLVLPALNKPLRQTLICHKTKQLYLLYILSSFVDFAKFLAFFLADCVRQHVKATLEDRSRALFSSAT